MAKPVTPTCYSGKVKAVPTGDCLLIMALTTNKPGPPPEKMIMLSNIVAPKLASRTREIGDEPFAWESREYLRKLCIGQVVAFRVDYTVPNTGREFGSVLLGNQDVALLVVSHGWAKVRRPEKQNKEATFLSELINAEEQAKNNGLGRWNTESDAIEASIRNLPPSSLGNASNFDALGLLAANKGRTLNGVVEHVRDGSTIRIYLLPSFHFVQVFVAGVQAPSAGRGAVVESVNAFDASSNEQSSDASETQAPLTSAQRLMASTPAPIAADPFGSEAKYFTELRVLNRDVRVVLESVDKFSNLIGSVFYPDGSSAKNLALELVENGLAKYVEWSASLMEDADKQRLEEAEAEAQKNHLKMWTNHDLAVSDRKSNFKQNFSGNVVEVISGDTLVVADDSLPQGSSSAERRVSLSSIICPKMRDPRRNEKPDKYAREAKELVRKRLIGQLVRVEMEYSRKVPMSDGVMGGSTGGVRVLDFGSVFVPSLTKTVGNDAASAAPPSGDNQQAWTNVAELVISRGFGNVIQHRECDERSKYYNALLAAELRAADGKKGLHSSKEYHITRLRDYTMDPPKKAKESLESLRGKRLSAIVEYVLSGHRFKLLIPKETCYVAFSFSGVRCPGRGEPYSEEAIVLMRQKIMQREVEIVVETTDRMGTLLGSLYLFNANMAAVLLDAGLAKLQESFFGFAKDRISDSLLLEQAEQSAKKKKLKVWEKYVEGEVVLNGRPSLQAKQKEVLQVIVTEVLDGGVFYVQANDQRIASIQQQLASLNLEKETTADGAFYPKRDELVLAQFSADESWNRAMVLTAPGKDPSPESKFKVLYVDYGNVEVVSLRQLRPLDSCVSSEPGLAQLCRLAYIKVPTLQEDFGRSAAMFFCECTLGYTKQFVAHVEERDASPPAKDKSKQARPILIVTLVPVDDDTSVNAFLVQEGLARVEKMNRWDSKQRKAAIENLEKFQREARKYRVGMWEHGDLDSDEEERPVLPVQKNAGRK